MSLEREYDILVYGASGFTGERVALLLARLIESGRPLRVALGGRTRARLEKVKENLARDVSRETAGKFAILIADANDEDALRSTFTQCKVVIQCAGPYRFVGESPLKVCAETGTHYVDITGEPQFIFSMALKYNDIAASNKSICINCCGFDSVPADMGVQECVNMFQTAYPDGALESVESVLELNAPLGLTAHYTTFECAVHGFSSTDALRGIRKRLGLTKERRADVPRLNAKAPPVRNGPFYHKKAGTQCFLFPGSDAAVVRNSQQLITYHHQPKNALPHYTAYAAVSGKFNALKLVIAGVFLKLFTKWRWGRSLLLKFPRFFTWGVFSHEGPTQAQLDATTCKIWFFCNGKPNSESSSNTSLRSYVSMPEPGYVATPMFCVEAATTILNESASIPVGVLTPAAAFYKTKYWSNLTSNGAVTQWFQ